MLLLRFSLCYFWSFDALSTTTTYRVLPSFPYVHDSQSILQTLRDYAGHVKTLMRLWAKRWLMTNNQIHTIMLLAWLKSDQMLLIGKNKSHKQKWLYRKQIRFLSKFCHKKSQFFSACHFSTILLYHLYCSFPGSDGLPQTNMKKKCVSVCVHVQQHTAGMDVCTHADTQSTVGF